MKTLVTVARAAQKEVLFNAESCRKLEALSRVDWIEEGKDYTSEDLARDIGPYDACITSWGSPKFTPAVLEKAVNLKFIGHAAGTVVPIVDKSVFARDIVVANANTALAASTAELALTLMLAGAWDINGYNSRLKQGQWVDNSVERVMGLQRQVIGLVGFGEISTRLIALLKPFNPTILLYSRFCTPEQARTLGVELSSLENLLGNSQIISLHRTLTSATREMLGREQLQLIRPGALLVNTARGGLLDQAVLLELLQQNRFFAALDVYEEEPLGKENPLLSLSNVLCTPHIGGFSQYWKTRLGQSVVDELDRWLKGEPLRGQITAEKFERLTPA